MSCEADLQALYDAIIKLGTGQQLVRVSHDGTASDYTPADLDTLLDIYRLLHNQCGAKTGLPRLDRTAMVGRGGPARTGFRNG